MTNNFIKHWISMVTAAALMLGCLVAPAAAQTTSTDTYVIRSTANTSLVIAEDSTSEGSSVSMDTYSAGDTSQQWKMIKSSDGYVMFENVESGNVLDTNGYGDGVSGTKCITWENNACVTEYWKLQKSGSNYLIVAKQNSNCALDANAYVNTIRDGTLLQIYTINNDPTQIWTLEKVSGSNSGSNGTTKKTTAKHTCVSEDDDDVCDICGAYMVHDCSRNLLFVTRVKNTEAHKEPNFESSVKKTYKSVYTSVSVNGRVRNEDGELWCRTTDNYYIFVDDIAYNFDGEAKAARTAVCKDSGIKAAAIGATVEWAVVRVGMLANFATGCAYDLKQSYYLGLNTNDYYVYAQGKICSSTYTGEALGNILYGYICESFGIDYDESIRYAGLLADSVKDTALCIIGDDESCDPEEDRANNAFGHTYYTSGIWR